MNINATRLFRIHVVATAPLHLHTHTRTHTQVIVIPLFLLKATEKHSLLSHLDTWTSIFLKVLRQQNSECDSDMRRQTQLVCLARAVRGTEVTRAF